MSNTKKKTTNFLLQGSILAFAGILVRVIGLIYRVPLTNIIGDTANGYYGSAFDIYSILLLISSQSMPIAVSKLVSAKLAIKDNKNAHRIFIGALVYSIVVGLIVGLFAFFGADFLAGTLFKSRGAIKAVRILGITVFFVCIMGVFRGYFQGMGDIGPTAVSQVFEQIVNAIVSVAAAYYLYNYGMSLAYSTRKQQLFNAESWGAAGGTLGTCLGAFAAFVILIGIYQKRKKSIKSDILENGNHDIESYRTITKVIFFTITPILLSTTVYQIGNLLDNAIFGQVQVNLFGFDEVVKNRIWGIYSGKYKLLTTMPIAIASALTLSMVPTIVKSYTLNEIDQVKNKINGALRFTMIITVPCGIGLSLLGGPICVLLFPSTGNRATTTLVMMFSIFTVAAFSLSTITNSVLQGIDKLKVPIYNSAISLFVHLIFITVLLIPFKLGIFGVVIGDFTFAMMVCFLNARALKKYLGYTQDVVDTFVKPLGSGIIMGAVSYIVFLGTKILLENVGLDNYVIRNDISVILAILVAIPVYFIVLIKIKGIDEAVLLGIPKGEIIVRLCKKLHLL
ncbi:MAG: polysaccharide biosynthesis protein [Lachnospiraceae bacterium]|nr:polysaccharide biosynthesis protein [Lachnospiraceae bacterium]